jgi:hypothetical protein
MWFSTEISYYTDDPTRGKFLDLIGWKIKKRYSPLKLQGLLEANCLWDPLCKILIFFWIWQKAWQSWATFLGLDWLKLKCSLKLQVHMNATSSAKMSYLILFQWKTWRRLAIVVSYKLFICWNTKSAWITTWSYQTIADRNSHYCKHRKYRGDKTIGFILYYNR